MQDAMQNATNKYWGRRLLAVVGPSGEIVERACRRCNVMKPASHFRKDSRVSVGLHSYCLECERHEKREYVKRPGVSDAKSKYNHDRWASKSPEQKAEIAAKKREFRKTPKGKEQMRAMYERHKARMTEEQRRRKSEIDKARRQRNKEKIKEQQRAWMAAHKGYGTEWCRRQAERKRAELEKWIRDHPEEHAENERRKAEEAARQKAQRLVAANAREKARLASAEYKAKCRKYYQNNKEKIRARQNEWYARNADYASAKVKEWQKKNPEKYKDLKKAASIRRRGREKKARGKCTSAQLKSRMEFYGNKCAYCGGPFEVVENALPLSRYGLNFPAALRPACRKCNDQKSANTIAEWKEYRQRRGQCWPPKWSNDEKEIRKEAANDDRQRKECA